MDNLKAAVLKADWFDPELNPKLESFARHYGTVILPTKPRTPRHKGKVERGVDYVQENAVKGRQFESLEAHNEYLRQWEKNVADQRIHGTTKRQVSAAFEAERPYLIQLPRDRFPLFVESTRIVARDGHIAVAKSFYSLPPEYMGHTVMVRYDSHLVRTRSATHTWTIGSGWLTVRKVGEIRPELSSSSGSTQSRAWRRALPKPSSRTRGSWLSSRAA